MERDVKNGCVIDRNSSVVYVYWFLLLGFVAGLIGYFLSDFDTVSVMWAFSILMAGCASMAGSLFIMWIILMIKGCMFQHVYWMGVVVLHLTAMILIACGSMFYLDGSWGDLMSMILMIYIMPGCVFSLFIAAYRLYRANQKAK